MAYALRSDLEYRFGTDEIAQRETMLGVNAVDLALTDAQGQIDGYLDNRYLVPLSPVPAPVVKCCCDIARYNLAGDTASDDCRKRYQDAITYLQAIQTGDLNLDGVPAKTGGSPSARVELVGTRRVFKRGLL